VIRDFRPTFGYGRKWNFHSAISTFGRPLLNMLIIATVCLDKTLENLYVFHT